MEDKANTVTGEYSDTENETKSAVVRDESGVNQVKRIESRDASTAESLRITSGNRITGAYSVSQGTTATEASQDRKVSNQSLEITTKVESTSSGTISSEFGNTITGEFTSISTGTQESHTEEGTEKPGLWHVD